MIYIICKILVLLKNHHNYLKDNVFECFFKKYDRLLFFFILFFPEEENIVKDKRNLFGLKKEQNDSVIKDIRNLLRLKKEVKGIKDIDT